MRAVVRIVEAPAAPETATSYLSVVSARVVALLTLAITFSDGETCTVDFGPFLRAAGHPDVRAYLGDERFGQFRAVDGNVNWNDYDLIFPVADLCRGVIS